MGYSASGAGSATIKEGTDIVEVSKLIGKACKDINVIKLRVV